MERRAWVRLTTNRNKRSDSPSDAEERPIQVADTKLLFILVMPRMKVVLTHGLLSWRGFGLALFKWVSIGNI